MFTPVLTLWLLSQTFEAPVEGRKTRLTWLFLSTLLFVPALSIGDAVFFSESGATKPTAIFASLFVIGGFLFSIQHLLVVYQSTKLVADKLRIRYLVVALSGAVLFMAIENLGRMFAAPIDPVLLTFANRGVLLQGPIPPISVFFSIAALYFLYHLQVHSRLLDLQDLLGRVVLLTLLALTLVFVESAAGFWLRAGIEGYALHTTFQLFLGSFAFLIVYEPLRGLYERGVKRLVNRRGQRLSDAIRVLSRNLSVLHTEDQLSKSIVDVLQDSGRIDQISVYLVHEFRIGFSLVRYRNNADSPPLLSAVVDDRFVLGFQEGEHWYVRRQLETRDTLWTPTAVKLMEAMSADVTLPLYAGKTLMGFLNISDVAWSVGYSGEELRHFARLTDQIGFALSNIHDIASHERRMRLAALGEMSTGLAHEIRNPLAGIKGAAQFLQGEELPEDTHEMLSVVVSEANKLNLVVSQFLDYARPYEVEAKESDPNELVTEVVSLLQAQGGGVEIVTNLATDLPKISFDAAKISQVLLNLCQNGIQAMEGEGTLTVTTRRSPVRMGRAGIAFLVKDEGPGFSKTVKENLFVPFYTTKRGGTGLGLAIVERIVAEHGGEIDWTSPEGGGALFVVRLPITTGRVNPR
jgi:signal transduction histidine kinase